MLTLIMEQKSNAYQDAARLRKVLKITSMLRQIDATPSQVAGMTDEQWELAAKAAEVNMPSAATRALVIDAMAAPKRPFAWPK